MLLWKDIQTYLQTTDGIVGVSVWVARFRLFSQVLCQGSTWIIFSQWMTLFRIQQWLKHLATPACLHLFMPIPLYGSFTEGSVDKPAQMTSLEFPRWAHFLAFEITLFCGPARLMAFTGPSFHGEQKKDLSLRVDGHRSPSLLVTMDGF
jgi:hypothetical protein